MSTAPSKQNHTLLYLLLGGVALWLGWGPLRQLYHALSYAGLNTLLALDLSVYGQLAGRGWPSFALLGAGLGAAAGAIVAQRRFGLARGVAVAGWAGMVLLLGLVYVTVEVEADPEMETTYAAPPEPAVAEAVLTNDTAPPAAESEQPASPAPPAPDTSSVAAEGWQQVVVQTASLHASWADSLARPVAYLHTGDSVQLRRQAHAWVLVAKADADGLVTLGWLRAGGLGPVSTPVPSEPIAKPAVAAPVAITSRKMPKPTLIRARDTAAAAAAAHPTGHQQRTGQINGLAVTFSLDWQPAGELSGSYFYDQQPGTQYRLTGAVSASGELRLLEFTRGRQTARGVLQREGEGYTGQLLVPDGRQLPIRIE